MLTIFCVFVDRPSYVAVIIVPLGKLCLSCPMGPNFGHSIESICSHRLVIKKNSETMRLTTQASSKGFLSPLYTRDSLICTLANNEDSYQLLHKVVFHLVMYCLLRRKWSSGEKLQFCLVTITCEPYQAQ